MLLHLDGRKLVLLCIGGRIAYLLLPEPPTFHLRAFCRDCAVAVTGKGCMRSPRLRRGRARRRRRHGGSRSERSPPGDDGGGGDPPPRSRALFMGGVR